MKKGRPEAVSFSIRSMLSMTALIISRRFQANGFISSYQPSLSRHHQRHPFTSVRPNSLISHEYHNLIPHRVTPALNSRIKFSKSTVFAEKELFRCRLPSQEVTFGRARTSDVPQFRANHGQSRQQLKYGMMLPDGGDIDLTTTSPLEAMFAPGTKIQVEVVSFGPLGATVDVIAVGSHEPDDIISEDEAVLATGLILQREISYFRSSRNNVDVVRGEILPAYVEKIRQSTNPDDGPVATKFKLDISLREYGGRAKAEGLSGIVLERLARAGGTLNVGDKSDPEDIARLFPGTSKATFKKCISGLYKQQLVQPSPFSITLIEKKKNEAMQC
jgi:CvfB-like winged helix domain